LPLPAFAVAVVFAVILSEAKDPEELHQPQPPEPFNQQPCVKTNPAIPSTLCEHHHSRNHQIQTTRIHKIAALTCHPSANRRSSQPTPRPQSKPHHHKTGETIRVHPESANGTPARVAAAAIAAIAWIGLIVQFFAVYQETSSTPLTLWILFAFFTITTNLLVAAVFTAIAAGRTALRSDGIVAGTMLSILLVGIIYALLLHGRGELSGHSAVANALLHMVTPIVVPLFWIAFTPKGNLTRRHPLLWAIYPLAYLAYALVRGAATANYAYPFLNVTTLGWTRTAINALCIAIAFMLSGYAIVWIDDLIGSRSSAWKL
jgi:hypothetical protein